MVVSKVVSNPDPLSEVGFRRRLLSQDSRLRKVARAAVEAIEAHRATLTPADLDELQTAGRQTLLFVLEQVREWEGRRAERKERLATALEGRPDRGAVLGRVDRGAKLYYEMLKREKLMVLQIGDALAWMVLGADPHRLVPLFALERAHVPIQTGTGLAAVASVAGELNRSGNVFAIENDLCRCIGTGDLTVRMVDAPRQPPLAIEIKGKGTFGKGEFLDIQLFAALSDSQADIATWETIQRVIDSSAGSPGTNVRTVRIDERVKRQEAEMMQRAQRIRTGRSGPVGRLGVPRKTLWKPLNNVLRVASITGRAIDLIEKGVWMMAVRVSHGDDARAVTAELIQHAGELGVEFSDYRAMYSLQLINHAGLAPLVVPIPLWQVNIEARVDLLTVGLIYVCAVDQHLWTQLFGERGMELEEVNGAWRVSRGAAATAFSRIEVAKLQYGVAFSGISPSAVAEQLDIAMK